MLTRCWKGAAAALLMCGAALAQGDDFQWSGAMNAGDTLTVRGINGRIRAEPSGSGTALITARKWSKRDHPDSVEIRVVEHGDGVTVCALYPDRRGKQPNECLPFGEGNSSNEDNDVVVNFTIRVPRGVHLIAKTVNGDVAATDLEGDVEGYTVNGGVEISTAGLAAAKTVNGSIRASMGRSDWDGELAFETVNGGIDLRFGADLSTELDASTLNGDIESDFEMLIEGNRTERSVSWRPGKKRNVRATIGNRTGDRELRLKTVNGSIRIRDAR